MVQDLRKKYNQEFTDEKYDAFLQDLNTQLEYPADFRVAETPLLLSADLTAQLEQACADIVAQLRTDEFVKHSAGAIPPGVPVPNEDAHPKFLQIDFAIAQAADGSLLPKLIELQGFPSLYAFQVFMANTYKKHFSAIPSHFTPYFSGYTQEKYVQELKDVIVADENPENVILLEIEPTKQKTRVDFSATKALLGIDYVCISDIERRGNKLYYKKDGKDTPINRIYNRVIYDELKRKGTPYSFRFTDELDVTWVGHPNWFFKISKYTLPFLKGINVPECYFLDQLESYPEDLSRFVLKPLYSFAGLGVEVDVTKERLDAVTTDRHDYILQEKVEYAPLIETPDGYSKVEIRMMYLWNKEPKLVNNLVRMSKGKMMGVDFNKNKTWVGSCCAFHE